MEGFTAFTAKGHTVAPQQDLWYAANRMSQPITSFYYLQQAKCELQAYYCLEQAPNLETTSVSENKLGICPSQIAGGWKYPPATDKKLHLHAALLMQRSLASVQMIQIHLAVTKTSHRNCCDAWPLSFSY
jgi:hypothetical protein